MILGKLILPHSKFFQFSKRRQLIRVGVFLIYKSMAKDWAKAFYNSPAWRAVRQSYISERVSIDGGLCEVCHQRLGYIVHHKKKLTPLNVYDPSIALNKENLSYECKYCHDREEGHYIGPGGAKISTCVFDSFGNPISVRECDKTSAAADSPIT